MLRRRQMLVSSIVAVLLSAPCLSAITFAQPAQAPFIAPVVPKYFVLLPPDFVGQKPSTGEPSIANGWVDAGSYATLEDCQQAQQSAKWQFVDQTGKGIVKSIPPTAVCVAIPSSEAIGTPPLPAK